MMHIIRNAATYRKVQIHWFILIVLATATIHLTGSFWIGYVSDDYDLLQQAVFARVFRPFEGHHFSPVVTALFKLAAIRDIAPIWWHALALFIHAINTGLVLVLASIGFNLHKRYALTIAAIFAFSAAGYEALAWACAIGYVLVMPCMLLAVLAVTKAPAKRIYSAGMLIAFLQACALFIWDWGILLFPLVFVAAIARRAQRRDITLRRTLIMLLPCALVWFLLLFLKRALGYQPGYHAALENLVHGAKMVAAAPITNLFPNTTLTFLKSPVGMLSAAAIWTVLCWSAMKNRIILSALSLYLVCILPVTLFGALQSRYAYIATPFLAIVVVCALMQTLKTPLGAFACLLLLAGHATFAIQRSQLWLNAYRAAVDIRSEIQDIRIPQESELVIVNLPDSFGPPNLNWRPFIWRNGLSSFDREIRRVNTPDCPFVWREAPIPVMSRDQIAARHSGSELYEVVYRYADDWRRFRVVPLRDASRCETDTAVDSESGSPKSF